METRHGAREIFTTILLVVRVMGSELVFTETPLPTAHVLAGSTTSVLGLEAPPGRKSIQAISGFTSRTLSWSPLLMARVTESAVDVTPVTLRVPGTSEVGVQSCAEVLLQVKSWTLVTVSRGAVPPATSRHLLLSGLTKRTLPLPPSSIRNFWAVVPLQG